MDSSELFDKVRNNEAVFVDGIEGVIPSMSVSYGNSVSEINKVREVMNLHYCLTDQGHLEYYLGVEATQPL